MTEFLTLKKHLNHSDYEYIYASNKKTMVRKYTSLEEYHENRPKFIYCVRVCGGEQDGLKIWGYTDLDDQDWEIVWLNG